MIRQILACLVALVPFSAAPAQPIPQRFEPLLKNKRFKLERVHGLPEVQFGGSDISANGKFALFAEALYSKVGDESRWHTRLLLYDLEAKTWPHEFELKDTFITTISLSADGKKLLHAGIVRTDKKVKVGDKLVFDHENYLGLFDLTTGKVLKTIRTIEFIGKAIALSPDGKSALASGDVPGLAGVGGESYLVPPLTILKLWNLENGKELEVYGEETRNAPVSLAFLPDGKQFLAGYQVWDKVPELKQWNLRDKSYHPYKNSGSAWRLGVSSDGKRFASGDKSSLTLWETSTRKKINSLKAEKTAVEQEVNSIAVCDDGKTVISVWQKPREKDDELTPSRLVAWDGVANKILWSHAAAYRGGVPMVVKGDKLLVGSGPNLLEVWNIKNGKKIDCLGGHVGAVNSIAVLPKGAFLSGGEDGQIILWQNGKITKRLNAHAGPITTLAVDAARKQWLSAGADKSIKVWGLEKEQPVHILKGHAEPVTSLAVFDDGRYVVAGGGTGSVKIWDIKTGKEVCTLAENLDRVNAIAVSPDNSWVAISWDRTRVDLFPIKNGTLDDDRDSVALEGHHTDLVMCLAFSPDGKTLLSGSQDQTVGVWDWQKRKAVHAFTGHKGSVTSVMFVDAKTVLTTSDDRSLCMWNVETCKETGLVDLGSVGDSPRCLARVGDDRILVGSRGWLIYEFSLSASAADR